jgi:hypothetical protein
MQTLPPAAAPGGQRYTLRKPETRKTKHSASVECLILAKSRFSE